jgi:selenocysteine lyase/cysteine desulfurase
MDGIRDYERTLSGALLDAIEAVPGGVVHGVTDRARLTERVPTVSFTIDGVEAAAVAAALAARDIGLRSGHMYSPRLMTRLGLLPGGTIRVSLVHYNTIAEVDRFRDALAEVVDELR